jgi:hypothetical protein
VAKNVADRDKSQGNVVEYDRGRVFMIGKLYALATLILKLLKTKVVGL